jgi:site-specific DNA-methyltransferase (adenine-specific)
MELLLGNCLDRLKDLEDNSVDAIVTDPPYGLSFMGKKWDYDVPSVDIWKECLRVLKPGGYLLSFAGTRTQHRMAVNIEDAGFEIRDMIAWVYGSGFPKSLNIGKAVDKLQGNERKIVGTQKLAGTSATLKGNPNRKNWYDQGKGGTYTPEISITRGTSQWEGWGTALKPALEPITVARKPLGEKTVAENCLKWGVGGINIDGCRVEYTDGTTEEQIRRKYSGSNEGNGSVTNNFGVKDIKMTSESTLTGRFPANLIHDGSEEVVGLFPQTKSGKAIRHNSGGNTFGGDNEKPPMEDLGYDDSGSASRFFYCAKASKKERNIGCEGLEEQETVVFSNGKAGRCPIHNKTNPSGLNTYSCGCPIQYTKQRKEVKKNTNTHPTVKPIALMEYLVKLVSREGQVVLDPFMGSGTTGMACKRLDRDFIGIEMMPEYMEIAKCRIEGVKKREQLNMI